MYLTKPEIMRLMNIYGISQREILLILANILTTDYTSLFFAKNIQISDEKYRIFLEFLKRHSKGEPIAKIIEKKEFYGIEFKTTLDTLDPRPETELLIDLFRETYSETNESIEVLDLGAGTGCVGLVILTLYPAAKCTFVDIDEKALNIAKYNASKLNLGSRSTFIKSNWFSEITERFDAIITNPPYVPDWYNLSGGALYDPPIALFGGEDGQRDVQIILGEAVNYLKCNGVLLMEGLDFQARHY
ncbi:MAG: peptide chain release factor N(5)-glutamine methyltransferase [Holosporales bacterium]|jgi:release factor glutamine methyltransferase|nr:peptide chain release factor N(5)-glutamine methyltransferase [Holosporales bacterium]